MGIFSCDYLKSSGSVLITYTCNADKSKLEKYTVENVCTSDKRYQCETYKKASRLFCIATAATDALGRSRNCTQLRRLLDFRRHYLEVQPEGQAFLAEYDVVGPQIVAAINAQIDARDIYRRIDDRYLTSCLRLLDGDDLAGCFALYREMFTALRQTYLPEGR